MSRAEHTTTGPASRPASQPKTHLAHAHASAQSTTNSMALPWHHPFDSKLAFRTTHNPPTT